MRREDLKAKYTALDIANFYIDLSNCIPENSIDNLKLSKLLFFAQGWYMVKFGLPLFDDDIQAWDYGPVIPSVYRAFKCCGANDIEEPTELFDEHRLSNDEVCLLLDVYSEYGKYTGWALKNMTHEKGTPWDKVYEKNMNHVISKDSIQEFFRGKKLESFNMKDLNIPIVTEIPLDWDNQEDDIYGQI